MRRLILAVLATGCAAWAQMSMQQRVDDFNYLAGLLNRNHAAYEWKQRVFGFDMLDTKPWLERVRNAKDDFEFYDLCMEYVGSLRDANTYLQLPSDFEAYLGFTADLYDGKAIVEFIDRAQLPAARFAIATGDELVSIDGIAIGRIIADYGKYGIEGNQRATDRFAVDFATYRPQAFVPRAGELGATSKVVLRKPDGEMVTLDLPWLKFGTPMKVGPVPEFGEKLASAASYEDVLSRRFRLTAGRQKRATAGGPEPAELNAITVAPVFNLPANFGARLGRGRADQIFSGSYQAEGKRIGYLRIPAATTGAAFLTQLDTEIVWLAANTDVLVLDQMRDRLTDVCAGERVAARFIGRNFTQPGFAIRATWSNLLAYEDTLELLKDLGAPADLVGGFEDIVRALRAAYSQNRGMTGAVPFCGVDLENRLPVRDRAGSVVAYTKPILLLTDELSTDFVPAILQDEGRAKVFGSRTRGYQGQSFGLAGPAFSEMFLSVKDAAMVRSKSVKNPGYPEGPYVENAGVHPEVEVEYRTLENRRTNGAAYVEAFTKAALALLP